MYFAPFLFVKRLFAFTMKGRSFQPANVSYLEGTWRLILPTGQARANKASMLFARYKQPVKMARPIRIFYPEKPFNPSSFRLSICLLKRYRWTVWGANLSAMKGWQLSCPKIGLYKAGGFIQTSYSAPLHDARHCRCHFQQDNYYFQQDSFHYQQDNFSDHIRKFLLQSL